MKKETKRLIKGQNKMIRTLKIENHSLKQMVSSEEKRADAWKENLFEIKRELDLCKVHKMLITNSIGDKDEN